MPRNNRRCDTCDFYETSGISHRGGCRRYPPGQQKELGTGINPTVLETRSFEWCGEWRQAQVDPEPSITLPAPDNRDPSICHLCEHQRGRTWPHPALYNVDCPAHPKERSFVTGAWKHPLCKDANPDGKCKLYKEVKQ